MKLLKTLALLVPLAFLLSTASFAQDLPEPVLKAMENKELATVVIYRTPQFQGALANWAVFEGDERLCKLSNKRYMIYQREPGNVKFRVQVGGVTTWPKKKTYLEIPLEAGEAYFIKTNLKTSITRARVELSEVVERTAKKEMKKLVQDRCDLADDE